MTAVQLHKFIYDGLKTGKQQVELPMTTFTRMCYSYLHNDWTAFLSSGLKLSIALIMITIGHFNSDT
ncbi:MAG: hypothetical protein C0490_10025 [Marivirga sp.]|nr:hypothetical protein [Marivirga sp.]